MTKRGKIKYADTAKGYGYILADDASNPSETILFKTVDSDARDEDLDAGTSVVFEYEPRSSRTRATNVKVV